NDPEANENITRDVKNALKLAGEIIDIISSKTVSRPYNYSLDNYAHSWEEEYKHISKKTFYPTLLFWLKEQLQTDNSINITYPTINDFSKIDYNEYIKLIVPFDNDTIYYENNVWKAKQSGEIPSDVIKDSDLDKKYIDKENNKYIVKTSQDINTKQNKLVSGTNIKTINGNSLLGNGDIYISGGSKWEVVDTSDFNPTVEYQIKNFDKDNYIYAIWVDSDEYSYGPLITKPKFTKPHINGVAFGKNPSLETIYCMELSTNGITRLHNFTNENTKLYDIFIQRKKVI
ncbi:hypothetical protein, partial [Spiroplasma endosymbiont of Megaselia nigra]|uniref:hypothetical protein n=1 Tax=Spiroplasma endosymbiont of Megaselia nigra TaxID=2478537 RepID=UPI000FA81F84